MSAMNESNPSITVDFLRLSPTNQNGGTFFTQMQSNFPHTPMDATFYRPLEMPTCRHSLHRDYKVQSSTTSPPPCMHSLYMSQQGDYIPLYQRLSVHIQRLNAVAFHGTFDTQHNIIEDYSHPRTMFSVNF